VVEVGFTVVDPMRVEVEKLPGVMATDEALLMFQERVLVAPEDTMLGDALKEEMEGVEDELSNSYAPASQAVEPPGLVMLLLAGHTT
jgi:hypothetical protein